MEGPLYLTEESKNNLILKSLSINLYWLNLPCHVSNRLRRFAADFYMDRHRFYRSINLDVLLQELTYSTSGLPVPAPTFWA